MSDKKKEPVVLDKVPIYSPCGDHVHVVGHIDGVLHLPDAEPEGETIYEDSSGATIGYSPRYAKNYDNLDWGDSDKAN